MFRIFGGDVIFDQVGQKKTYFFWNCWDNNYFLELPVESGTYHVYPKEGVMTWCLYSGVWELCQAASPSVIPILHDLRLKDYQR